MGKQEIKEIYVITYQEVSGYVVGKIPTGRREVVTKIVDRSIEWEYGGDYIYEIYSEDKLIARLENCPVEIVYKQINDMEE